jgi:hypothetical protein
MLCRPFEKFIPRFFKRDDKLNAFADKHDNIMESIEDDTIGLNDIIDPAKAPTIVLNELGYYLNASLRAQDTDKQKRIKIATAIQGHKKRATFKYDAKPKIDAIALGDSVIIRGVSGDDWILTGDGLTPSTYYWGSMGCDGIDDDLGLGLIGDGNEIEIAGNIYIDVDNNSLSASEIAQIVFELEIDIAPAYMKIFLGYIDGTGVFIVYDVIE